MNGKTRGRLALAAIAIGVGVGCAAIGSADGGPETLPLWPEGAPGAVGKTEADVPSITVYRPEAAKATGAAVVVCPGGGYGGLAIDHEGKQVAEWLNGLGVTAVVLKYRLGPRYHHPAMLQDAQRAIRTVRARARDWDLDPKRVAILGFSAGGHLASTAATHFDDGKPDAPDPIDRQSSRPDRAILIYPVIALATPHGHAGSRRNLLGDSPSKELLNSLSNETQVTSQTPPTFLAHTNEDTAVPPENSLLFVMALRAAKVPVEFHLFEKGPHGLGLGGGARSFGIRPDPAFAAWPSLCATWLKGQGFLEKK
ncbi:MAG TPA: alpha/beta hydrolase [Isosphaeraceae bacterium]|jgi:acetyl esterase/lipase|nr:alpha/beta hydrolase [Isosphaeraceae bacterium]